MEVIVNEETEMPAHFSLEGTDVIYVKTDNHEGDLRYGEPTRNSRCL